MDRETFSVILPISNIEATLLSELTFGESQAIDDVLTQNSFHPKFGISGKMEELEMDNLAFAEQREKKFLTIVVGLKKRVEGEEPILLPVSMATINGLPVRDGKLLLSHCDAVILGEKKSD